MEKDYLSAMVRLLTNTNLKLILILPVHCTINFKLVCCNIAISEYFKNTLNILYYIHKKY